MTETNQESAAPELPARPRVHQLAKHLGITSRELLAELAQLGHELRSASSVVVADVVTAEEHRPESCVIDRIVAVVAVIALSTVATA